MRMFAYYFDVTPHEFKCTFTVKSRKVEVILDRGKFQRIRMFELYGEKTINPKSDSFKIQNAL